MNTIYIGIPDNPSEAPCAFCDGDIPPNRPGPRLFEFRAGAMHEICGMCAHERCCDLAFLWLCWRDEMPA